MVSTLNLAEKSNSCLHLLFAYFLSGIKGETKKVFGFLRDEIVGYHVNNVKVLLLFRMKRVSFLDHPLHVTGLWLLYASSIQKIYCLCQTVNITNFHELLL